MHHLIPQTPVTRARQLSRNGGKRQPRRMLENKIEAPMRLPMQKPNPLLTEHTYALLVRYFPEGIWAALVRQLYVALSSHDCWIHVTS